MLGALNVHDATVLASARDARRSWLGFVAAAAVLVVVGVAVVASTLVTAADAMRIERMQQRLLVIERSVTALRSAEASQRLHVLTGEADSLSNFHSASAELLAIIERLRANPHPDAMQRQRIDSLIAMAEPRLEHARMVTRVYAQSGLDAAVHELRQGGGLALSREITQLAETIETIDEYALAAAQVSRRRNHVVLIALAFGGIGLSLAVLALVLRRVLRETHSIATAQGQFAERYDTARAAQEDMQALSRYAGLLQSCRSFDEALSVSQQTLDRLFPELGGALYLARASKDYAERMFTWGSLPSPTRELAAPDDCWALRRGHSYSVPQIQRDVKCAHVELPPENQPATTLCVPMSVQGESLGFLYLARSGEGPIARAALAEAASEQLALALFNLRLQDQLRVQSIRDPLTGLFNRRYLEESLTRETARAQRRDGHIAVLMIDVDHFKRFNDDHGHEAGDAVLRHVGELLRGQCRAEDVPCRYGGEEFTLILPDTESKFAMQRGDQIREAIARAELTHLGRPLPAITVTIGVATYPQQALRPDGLLRCADAALYAAKKAGRNQVLLAPEGS
ncbi:diguanylate cyclase [Alkalisalibacterium limincola]|nr:diguanylate cyclase [Alkalisalibacterium limincola]